MIYKDTKSLLKHKLIINKAYKIIQICWTVNGNNKEMNLIGSARNYFLRVILKFQVFLDILPR
jgi:hypothetical protein